MATDQEIRDQGFKYVPQQKYLLNPFQLSENQEPVTDSGIVATNAFTGGNSSDGFNVYNPDPNKIANLNYRPNHDYRKSVDYNPELSDLQNQKIMQGMPNFKGYDYYNAPDPTGLEALAQGAVSFIPGQGIARFIDSYLPVDRRSILENELAASNVRVDDIGRIVAGNSGSYYDPSGANIMSGYNAIKVTQDTFDKRRAKAKEKMSPEGFEKFNIALTAAEKNFLNADSESYKIQEFEEAEKEKKRKNNIISRIFSKKKEAANNVNTGKGGDKGGSIIKTNNNQSGSGDDKSFGGYENVAAYDASQQSNYDRISDMHNFAKGGRAGYFYGGRVNFKNGGLASIL